MKESEFNQYILSLRDRMFRFAQSLLSSPDEAADVTHDLLERLWRDRDGLDAGRNVASFVMTAVRNRCYDVLRRRRAGASRTTSVVPAAECATTETTDRWEARDLVRRAIAALPARQREVLHLKEIEGYPTREIAGMIACDEAQVRMILSRARCGLRETLKKMMDDERTERED